MSFRTRQLSGELYPLHIECLVLSHLQLERAEPFVHFLTDFRLEFFRAPDVGDPADLYTGSMSAAEQLIEGYAVGARRYVDQR